MTDRILEQNADLADQSPRAVLKRHGRSFHFAGQLLGDEDFRRSARLYAFCRWLDDLVDRGHPKLARRELGRIRRQLAGEGIALPVVADFLDLAEECCIPIPIALELIEGLEQDLEPVRVGDRDELIRYAYRVAGTVGLMMSRVLGARSSRARPFAIDLGIAMQLTNIARDVAEDARADRRYLPATWVGAMEPDELLGNPEIVRKACHRLLNLAENYYVSGLSGLTYLPLRARLGIGVAGRVYRQIGRRLLRQGGNPLAGRVVVPKWQKVALTPGSLLIDAVRRSPHAHQEILHRPLVERPRAARASSAPARYKVLP
ncbi:MAG: phytoene/squalene synthase family protein [Xanthomonadales bacterium]|nr:phytoene/squalene synthase family protein [Xanthomonadales bacterium]